MTFKVSNLSLRVAVIHRASNDALMEEARELLKEALEEIEDCLKGWEDFLEYIEPVQSLLKLPTLEYALKQWKIYHQALKETAKDLTTLRREKDFSRLVKGFHENADSLILWSRSEPPNAERAVSEELWNSPTGQRLSEKLYIVEEGPRSLEAFYREHR